jgi:hypothetical protein
VGGATEVGLFCGLDIPGCVLVDWEEGQILVYFVNWILLSVYW